MKSFFIEKKQFFFAVKRGKRHKNTHTGRTRILPNARYISAFRAHEKKGKSKILPSYYGE